MGVRAAVTKPSRCIGVGSDRDNIGQTKARSEVNEMSNTVTTASLRHLDAQIYERVFGLPVKWINGEPAFDDEFDDLIMPTEPFDWMGRYGYDVPHFSEDIDAAWEVVKILENKGWVILLENHDSRWHCDLWPRERVADAMTISTAAEIIADTTAPLAICRCALKVLREN